MRLYHGTSCGAADLILEEGFHLTTGTTGTGAKWFTLAQDKPSAVFHSYGCLVTFDVPKGPPRSQGGKWAGWPYLWPAHDLLWEGKKTKWYALRQPLPPEFILKIEPVRTSRK